MSHQYQKVYTPPEGFQEILKNFTREILREQPDNVYEFGAIYFKKLAEKEGGKRITNATENMKGSKPSSAKSPSGPGRAMPVQARPANRNINEREIYRQLFESIREADLDKNGFLYVQLILRSLRTLEIPLNRPQSLYVVCDCEVTDESTIEYTPALPMLTQRFVHVVKNNLFSEDFAPKPEDTVHGLNKAELEQEFLLLFSRSDATDSGRLSAEDFRKELEEAELDLSKRDLTVLLCEAEEDGDGMISYKQFIPKMHRLLYYVKKFDEVDGLSNSEY